MKIKYYLYNFLYIINYIFFFPGGKKCLVSKVFDLHSGAGLVYSTDDEVEVPWGVGILGHVAITGETVNLQVACEVRHI